MWKRASTTRATSPRAPPRLKARQSCEGGCRREGASPARDARWYFFGTARSATAPARRAARRRAAARRDERRAVPLRGGSSWWKAEGDEPGTEADSFVASETASTPAWQARPRVALRRPPPRCPTSRRRRLAREKVAEEAAPEPTSSTRGAFAGARAPRRGGARGPTGSSPTVARAAEARIVASRPPSEPSCGVATIRRSAARDCPGGCSSARARSSRSNALPCPGRTARLVAQVDEQRRRADAAVVRGTRQARSSLRRAGGLARRRGHPPNAAPARNARQRRRRPRRAAGRIDAACARSRTPRRPRA